MKFLLTLGAIITGGIVAVFGITALLVVDDLKACSKPSPSHTLCATADAIVVVSGGDTAARTAEAIALYKDGWAPTLLVAGAAQDTSGPSNAESMRRQAVKAGVPSDAILLDGTSSDTTMNARNAAQLLRGVKRIIVVTSPYHQRRASLEFKRAFGSDVTVVSHPATHDSAWGSRWWLTPLGWWLALSETVKTLFVMVSP